jgi:hypothetical protein
MIYQAFRGHSPLVVLTGKEYVGAGLVLLRYPDLRHLDFSDLGPPPEPESEPLPPNITAFRG